MSDKRRDYLDKVSEIYRNITQLDADYIKDRKQLKKDLADAIEEGKFEADLSVIDFADDIGVTRQTINKVLVDVLGVRHPDKAKAGSLGHKNG